MAGMGRLKGEKGKGGEEQRERGRERRLTLMSNWNGRRLAKAGPGCIFRTRMNGSGFGVKRSKFKVVAGSNLGELLLEVEAYT